MTKDAETAEPTKYPAKVRATMLPAGDEWVFPTLLAHRGWSPDQLVTAAEFDAAVDAVKNIPVGYGADRKRE